MKPLKPSHREKKRYLLIKGKDVNKKNIENVILEFIGVLGFAESSPQIVKSNKTSAILVINRKSLDKIRASFLMSKKDLQIVKVSGAIGNLK
jgi:RNase P/RNase MRP subunit POP5